MGVIDLNARLTALEKKVADDPSGEVIDQIEATVTALDETVNGNGETDLGLVGDVADLQSELGGLITDVTDLFTPSTGVTLSDASYLKAYKIGNMIFVHGDVIMTAGYETSPTRFHFLDIDSSIAPGATMAVAGLGGGDTQTLVQVSKNGYLVTGGGAYVNFGAFWTIAEPAPEEETPAEE